MAAFAERLSAATLAGASPELPDPVLEPVVDAEGASEGPDPSCFAVNDFSSSAMLPLQGPAAAAVGSQSVAAIRIKRVFMTVLLL